MKLISLILTICAITLIGGVPHEKEETSKIVPNSNWCLEYIDPETMPEDCLYIYNEEYTIHP